MNRPSDEKLVADQSPEKFSKVDDQTAWPSLITETVSASASKTVSVRQTAPPSSGA